MRYINNKKWFNYHKHDHKGNIASLDVVVKMEDYCKRALELGHTAIFTTNHGYIGDVHEAITLGKKYGLNVIAGIESYFVPNRFEKDKRNFHLIIIALNHDGFLDINRISSEANKTGYYYKPRIDSELLYSINPKNVVITTACTGGVIRDDLEDFESHLIKMRDYFKENFFLEIQPHKHPQQYKHNKRVKELSDRLGIEVISACDTHYISEKDGKYRDMFLNAKGIRYPEEDGYILDYPDYETLVNRYVEQGVFTIDEIEKAINNTCIFESAEPLRINDDIKLPKVSDDSEKEFKDIITKAWIKERENIPRSRWKEYLDAIRYESQIVIDTNMQDYFILDKKVVEIAVNKYGGVITRTGRGCFTEDSLVHTKNGLKSIKDVKVGDYVVTKDGRFNKVLNTMVYDIDEELVQIKHLYGTDKKNPTICTLDHKIYVNRNDENIWVQAKDINPKTDYVCVPKIKPIDDGLKVIDLVEYSDGYDYDEEYIYEKVAGKPYIYSPSDVARKLGVRENAIQKYANIEKYPDYNMFEKKKQEKLKEFVDYTGFSTREEYAEYVKENQVKKIRRYVEVDELFNVFVGLMYGDGFTNKGKKGDARCVGLAVNTSTNKNIYNRNIFIEMANRLNAPLYENVSKTKKLSQLYINSKVFANFVSKELFFSELGKEKQFNEKWFNQPKENLLGIVKGLQASDGSVEGYRISFDNTSTSIINAYKLLCLMTGVGVNSLQIRESYSTKDGYVCKKSYKLRVNPKSDSVIKKSERTKQDDDFYYLPLKEIVFLDKTKTRVYDITVENEHNYLLNNMIVHNSGPSFYINKLFRLTDIDRLNSPITLYPTRFISTARILETRSLPDLDLNVANQEPFIKAMQDLLGDDGVHWLLSYKPLQDSSAFRLFCKAKGMNINEYNDIAKDMDSYVDDPKWKDLIEESKVFKGVVESVSPSPCSFLLLDKPISTEVGIIKVGDVYCANLDGYNCDVYKYLKNDILNVKVWDLIDKTCKLAGIKIPTINELNELLDEETFKMYEMGLTCTLNQADSDFATSLIKRLKPKSVAEMSAFVASIRPGFASLLDTFIERKSYSTGVKQLDELLDDSFHFLMYQESIMKYLVWLGIEESITYDIIKKISKKKFEENELKELKDKLIKNWINKVGNEKGFDETWQVIEDASKYSFNASHSLSVGLDSLYGAYLKSHYPLEYYSVALNEYSGDIPRTARLVKELEYFGIKFSQAKFRYSRGKYFFDRDNKTIYKGIGSIKYLNDDIGEKLYELKDNKYEKFIDLLPDLHFVNSKQLKILIEIGFFDCFGKSKTLLNIVDIYNKYGSIKVVSTSHEMASVISMFSGKRTEKQLREIDCVSLCNYMISNLQDEELHISEIAKSQLEHTGSIDVVDSSFNKKDFIVADIVTKYKTPKATIYQVSTGRTVDVYISASTYNENPIDQFDLITVKTTTKKQKNKLIDGKWQKVDEYNYYITY